MAESMRAIIASTPTLAGFKEMIMTTVSELRAQAEELLRKALEQEEGEKKKLFDGILKKLDEAGQSMQSLMDYAHPKKKKGEIAPKKFRGPGGESWSGIGRHPAWFDAAVASGVSEESMLIK